jgi:hypothetical protein
MFCRDSHISSGNTNIITLITFKIVVILNFVLIVQIVGIILSLDIKIIPKICIRQN